MKKKTHAEQISSGTFLIIGTGETYQAEVIKGDQLLEKMMEWIYGEPSNASDEDRKLFKNLIEDEDQWAHDQDLGATWFKTEVGETDAIEIYLIPEKQRIGTELFANLKKLVPTEFQEVTIEVWTPTPWMIDVLTKDREDEIRRWCYQMLGEESSPIHHRKGNWHQSSVTMEGFCWFGFATQKQMGTFVLKFPSPIKQK